MNTLFSVVCVQVQNYCRRGEEYVKILQASVKRNLSVPYRFVCLTDAPFKHPEITFVKIGSELKGWWSKMRLYQHCTEGATLFLDLDTIVTGPLDSFSFLESDFAALRDFWRPEGLGSGVMFWRGDHSDIYRRWKKEGRPLLPGGDQEFLERCRPYCERLQEKLPGKIISMKPHGPGRILAAVPAGVSLVACHGSPKPHELKGWIEDYWRE